MAQAIASFEETLVTPSRFDKFLEGQGEALNEQEKKGLKKFVSNGCIACHNGAGIGGGSYQKFGAVKPYQHQKDEGRFEVTRNKEDKFKFKVPLLRNISKTYPYFHDGKVWDLKEAVQIMGKTQLGKDISDNDALDIVAFLDSLTGEVPVEARTLPVLPASTAITSQPEI